MRRLLSTAIRQFLGGGAHGKPKRPFRLRDGSFTGKGPAPGVREGDWQQIRSMAYEGRGG